MADGSDLEAVEDGEVMRTIVSCISRPRDKHLHGGKITRHIFYSHQLTILASICCRLKLHMPTGVEITLYELDLYNRNGGSAFCMLHQTD